MLNLLHKISIYIGTTKYFCMTALQIVINETVYQFKLLQEKNIPIFKY